MTVKKILTEPNKILRKRSAEVKKVDKNIKKLMDDMLETMYEANGIGLAAIQVGVSKRIIIVDISKDEEVKSPMYFINPKIIWNSKNNSTYEEGCLSVPGEFAEIERPDACHIQYLDYNGNKKKLKAEGLIATCIQHEIDHLEGILFIDYLSKLKKSMIVKKLGKQQKVLERVVV